jgi:hypothetical protein
METISRTPAAMRKHTKIKARKGTNYQQHMMK